MCAHWPYRERDRGGQIDMRLYHPETLAEGLEGHAHLPAAPSECPMGWISPWLTTAFLTKVSGAAPAHLG